MAKIDNRNEQMFPKLTPNEINRLRRFGEVRNYAPGEELFVTGSVAPGMYVLIKGSVRVTRRDPLGHSAPIVEEGPGQFVAEVGQLSGQPAFVDVHAIDDVEALLIPPDNLRALMIEEPELGERIMRALILRRIALIEAGAGGPVLIGAENSPDVIRLQGFLARNAYPHQLLDPAQDQDAAKLVEQYAPNPSDLPLAVCPKGTILKNPNETELARALGMVPIDERDRTYDVAVVGAGPAGLSTAVYAASEGFSVIVFDTCAFGGQAGASARIENYLGFPAGISGQALTGLAYVQAQKFGARVMIPSEVVRLDPMETQLALHLSDGRRVKASTVVVATGARYRRLNVPNLGDFEGRGVWYWASPIEARLCRDEEIVLVGGGNSAGQAAVFLRSFAKKIWMLVRGPNLAESMSQYLIDRIKAIGNIEVLTQTKIVTLYGSREKQLERVCWRNNVTGAQTEKPIRHVFCFIGAEPATGWLRDSGIALDGKNFVLTGSDVPSDARPSNNGSGLPLPLETSVRGVFASGDVRSGSVKRVGAAIGEGAVVGAELHVARADGPAESSDDAEKDSGMGSAGAMGMRLNPQCIPERAQQKAAAEISGGGT
ncbi:thioredoxin reductase (NADPH) [Bradyrhizobium elkanii]|uniref:FAD-dependent oxidoreductase n=1 Tax=Bradyrhizobium TaxID=374 RepID=UPI0021687021|nr:MULTISPECIES: cyclic nucleotide-binding domain-containing thioredoxin-disulfide reductase [Bradyrhizobium]MCS3928816.1 thioredoxin reductase (NADPH) [Bradyrhizobium elkanii]MCS3969370.1 thioredoxin reductase (NADPH) [Bradyrhizobium japonicum]